MFNSDLDDSDISLPPSTSRTNLILHNTSGIPSWLKKSHLSLIWQRCLILILKNCDPELLYILTELFNMCLKESCFRDCWKVSSVVPVFKNVGERPTANNYRPLSLLSVVSKVFEKFVDNRLADPLEKYGLFWNPMWFQVFSINCKSSDRFIW